MDLATFIKQRRPHWLKLETILKRVEGSGLGTLDDEQAVEFGRLYRSAASDLNQAQTFVSGDATVQYLNDLVARCYLVIYARTRTDWRGLLRHLVFGFPAVFRRNVVLVLLATAITVAGAVFGFVVSRGEPDWRQELVPGLESSIQPGQEGHLMTSGELAGLSSFYFTNNTRVSLIAFALGMTFGIGTAWLLWTNGIVIGAILAMFWEADQVTAFCTGILPHGVVELPAIVIAGAAGFLLAQGMIRARPWSRLDEMARVGKEALLLVSGCVPLLVAAAFIEAVIARAPDQYLASGLKLAVAGVVGLLFVAYVFLLGWRQPGSAVES